MKIVAASLVLMAALAPFALHAKSDEPAAENGSESPIHQELLETLRKAFDSRLAEFKTGRVGPIGMIRLNTQLYEAQSMSTVGGDQRFAAAGQYMDRAKQIEKIANDNLNSGRGTIQDALEAKASRLKAMLELSEFQETQCSAAQSENFEEHEPAPHVSGPAVPTTVSGVVTRKGQPLKGRILFHAKDDQIFGCMIGDDGKYLIKHPQVGNFRVVIEGTTSADTTLMHEMRATVVPGSNELIIDVFSDSTTPIVPPR